ncbi:hypothetical protein RB614_07685 [Phytohabitans sp. ZYX-F-186]|uniref:Tat pathway signal sequence domain protein n=1 Tax=Phytohabitans maris TaxID=3071409 RepID=A0ABU0ZBN5_9ACTN|nr:hypothetical protein [Phytohabitans sp. ZYX-F-186]MDQ7904403.1 hypothetical protein [Phytohabitans sp. ZYX-F-186]
MEHPWKSRAQRLRWGLGVASCTAVVALAVAWIGGATASTPNRAPDADAAAPASAEAEPVRAPAADPTPGPAPAAGTGRDPLTPSELDRARAAALAAPLAGATDVNGAAGPEYLSFELVETKEANAPRRAAVYLYDYTADKLVKRVVNLKTGAVEGTFAAAKRQPPPSDREVAKALALFLADGQSADFKSRYQKATGKAFTSADQVEITGTTYVARPADTGADQCGEHRCVQFITQVPNGPFIDITDIVVDLSGRTVARLR